MRKVSMKKLLAIAMTTLIAVSSLNTLAGPKHDKQVKSERSHKGQRFNITRMMKHFNQLDLSEAQQSDIKALLTEGVAEGKPNKEAMASLDKEIKELKKSETLDEQSIRAANIEIANLKSDLMIMRKKKKQEIEALLTEEQLSSLKKMKQERKQKRRKDNDSE